MALLWRRIFEKHRIFEKPPFYVEAARFYDRPLCQYWSSHSARKHPKRGRHRCAPNIPVRGFLYAFVCDLIRKKTNTNFFLDGGESMREVVSMAWRHGGATFDRK